MHICIRVYIYIYIYMYTYYNKHTHTNKSNSASKLTSINSYFGERLAGEALQEPRRVVPGGHLGTNILYTVNRHLRSILLLLLLLLVSIIITLITNLSIVITVSHGVPAVFVKGTSCFVWCVHPVSIARFPLRRFSPGAGLLRNRFVHR